MVFQTSFQVMQAVPLKLPIMKQYVPGRPSM
ncbi:UNVERIFIED_CONTAM: hypothetical protein GTU68_020657 [Idotea baltica]|nr:hypothetical protein [Idotea baltica]